MYLNWMNRMKWKRKQQQKQIVILQFAFDEFDKLSDKKKINEDWHWAAQLYRRDKKNKEKKKTEWKQWTFFNYNNHSKPKVKLKEILPVECVWVQRHPKLFCFSTIRAIRLPRGTKTLPNKWNDSFLQRGKENKYCNFDLCEIDEI